MDNLNSLCCPSEVDLLGIFIVTVREGAELALVVYCLLDGLRRIDGNRSFRAVPLAAVLGAATGAVAVAIAGLSAIAAWMHALLTAIVALLIIVLVTGGLETVSRIRRSIHDRLEGRPLRSAERAATTLALLTGVREGIEGAAQTLVLAGNSTPVAAGVAIAVGLAATIGVALLWPRLPTIMGATALFRLSALALALIAADMLVDALGILFEPISTAVPTLPNLPAEPFGASLAWVDLFRVALMAAILVTAMHRWWRGFR